MVITTTVRIAHAGQEHEVLKIQAVHDEVSIEVPDDETLQLVLAKLEEQCAFIRQQLEAGVARDDH